MNFTWKGSATNIIVPSNARPFTNNDLNLSSLGRTQGKANPSNIGENNLILIIKQNHLIKFLLIQ